LARRRSRRAHVFPARYVLGLGTVRALRMRRPPTFPARATPVLSRPTGELLQVRTTSLKLLIRRYKFTTRMETCLVRNRSPVSTPASRALETAYSTPPLLTITTSGGFGCSPRRPTIQPAAEILTGLHISSPFPTVPILLQEGGQFFGWTPPSMVGAAATIRISGSMLKLST